MGCTAEQQIVDVVSEPVYNPRPRLPEALNQSPARKIISHAWTRRAAVNLIVDAEEFDDASVLMIQRAQYEGDPWSGHMAFPGGRRDKVDRSTLHTAKRETLEELGFDMDAASNRHLQVAYIGRLSDRYARQRGVPSRMVISPYVYSLEQRPPLVPNYEVADTFWIPLEYFADFSQRRQFTFMFAGTPVPLPCYQYGSEQRVWGLSLDMIDELLRSMGFSIPATAELPSLD